MLEGRLAHQPTAFDAEMILRDRKRILSSNLFDGDAGDHFAIRDEVMRITAGPQQIGVKTAALAHTVQTIATVAERNGYRIVRVTRRDQGGNFQLPRWRQVRRC